MGKKYRIKIIDVTGVELMPGKPDACLGNGEHSYECCCDECEYYLLCFPGYDWGINKKNIFDDHIKE